jgi:2-keto-4-pentenoate hydratase/2-oxohepta-3-ene-1,7-dioic acid hydratase in catechol pathway
MESSESNNRIDIKTFVPGKLICVGMNYKSHILEQDGRFPEKPVLFAKSISSIIKNGENIIYPEQTTQLDYEVELAVIIGKRMKNIAESRVPDFIYGYTVMNDITARDCQKSDGQWFRSKSFDTFAPIGPEIILKENLTDAQNLNLKSYVNGEMRQNSNTSDMIFKINELISFISMSMTLERGDLISTGTPAGVGIFMKEKKLLMPGDEIVCEIEKIGTLVNKVAAKVK